MVESVAGSGTITGSGMSGTRSPNSRSRLGSGCSSSSSGYTTASSLALPQVTSKSAEVPHTMLSPSAVPQTMLSPGSAVPQTMLSPGSSAPQTTVSQSAPPQSVPHTML